MDSPLDLSLTKPLLRQTAPSPHLSVSRSLYLSISRHLPRKSPDLSLSSPDLFLSRPLPLQTSPSPNLSQTRPPPLQASPLPYLSLFRPLTFKTSPSQDLSLARSFRLQTSPFPDPSQFKPHPLQTSPCPDISLARSLPLQTSLHQNFSCLSPDISLTRPMHCQTFLDHSRPLPIQTFPAPDSSLSRSVPLPISRPFDLWLARPLPLQTSTSTDLQTSRHLPLPLSRLLPFQASPFPDLSRDLPLQKPPDLSLFRHPAVSPASHPLLPALAFFSLSTYFTNLSSPNAPEQPQQAPVPLIFPKSSLANW